MSTATIEKNDVHNYRTADISDALGDGVHSAIDSLATARSMAHVLAEALPDDADDDIDDAAGYFELSLLTIKTTLVNKGVIERDNFPSD